MWVGDEWTVEVTLGQDYSIDPYGNNGPDPLNLELAPTGPVEPGAGPTGAVNTILNTHAYDGNGEVKARTAIGAWAHGFDSNSSPGVARFSDGADVENFEGINATALGSYDPGQLIATDSRFSSRDPGRTPTFHSGGASPGDPVGNPGTPIGIIDPSAGIGADVKSGIAVGAPLVINEDQPWNGAFMEVIFSEPVERVGFWITHGGTVNLDLRDVNGSTLPSGPRSPLPAPSELSDVAPPTPSAASVGMMSLGSVPAPVVPSPAAASEVGCCGAGCDCRATSPSSSPACSPTNAAGRRSVTSSGR